MFAGLVRPAKSQTPTSYLKIFSSEHEKVGQGKSYDFSGERLAVKTTPRTLDVQVDGWTLKVGPPQGFFFVAGEYKNAMRANPARPTLDFSGQGRNSGNGVGEFAVWEIEFQGNQVSRAAIDFIQRLDHANGQPLLGKLRINSTFQ
jgi:hypothetical protein